MSDAGKSVQRYSSRNGEFDFDDEDESTVVSTTGTAVAQQLVASARYCS
mgnify:CR=1 FL=1